MRVSATTAAVSKPSGALPGETERHEKPAPGRALIAVTPPAAAQEATTGFRQAPFLAQLIATKEQLSQTRERRRAEPGEAIAAYRVTASLAF